MSKKIKNENSLLQEKTLPQVFYQPSQFDSVLPLQDSELNYDQLRQIAKDPLINLCRNFLAAATLLSGWSIRSKANCPDEIKVLIEENILPKREEILLPAIYGCIDFGFSAFEKVFEYKEGKILLKKLKPLLPDLTEIVVDTNNGKFIGLRCRNLIMSEEHHEQYEMLDLPKSLVLNINQEGGNLYGKGLLISAFEPWKNWHFIQHRSNDYCSKMSGSHYVLKYPLGLVQDGGRIVSTSEVAGKLLSSLENNNPIAIPKSLERQKDSTSDADDAWEIDILTDPSMSSTNSTFIDKQKYLDSKITEAFGIPARTILEGNFGTKAESQTVTDTSLILMDARHRVILQQINKHVVNQIIRLNYGEEYEDCCYLEPTPLSDANIHFLQAIYNQLLSIDPTEQDDIDRQSLRDKLGIPTDTSTEEQSIFDLLKEKVTKNEIL